MSYPIIILVEPSHPGNIGAIARAMKTMGHTQLRLVNPKCFPHETANTRASGAVDILQNAQCFPDLTSALADCHCVLATSARPRTLNWTTYTPKQAAKHLAERQDQSVALVFGRESSGLTNDELNLCQGQIVIPTHSQYQSLNLAHAVQILTYECANVTIDEPAAECTHPTHAAHMHLKTHLSNTIENLPHFTMVNSKHTLNRIFCLINRAQPTQNEMNLLRGILTAIDHLIKLHRSPK